MCRSFEADDHNVRLVASGDGSEPDLRVVGGRPWGRRRHWYSWQGCATQNGSAHGGTTSHT